MALQQHLADTCRTAEVTVDLEGWVRIEEVGIGAAPRAPLYIVGDLREHVLDNLEGVVAVEHARPEVDLPAQTPASGHIAALLQGIGCSREKFKVAEGRNLVGRIEAIEVGDVAVLVLGIVTVDEPLLQLAVLAYLHRREFFEGGL